MTGSRRVVAMVVAVCALAAPAVAWSAFPGQNFDESVRLNTPNDPKFDRCEPDNEGGPTCQNVFDQQFARFGFAPAATQATATYRDPRPRQARQNTLAGRNPQGQLSGVSADRAWKLHVGRPDVEIAILDTGIRWEKEGLRAKLALNEDELPTPSCGRDDCNNDGVFNVDDFAGQVAPTAGHAEADGFLDVSDLLATFSNGDDADGNGFVDDISGWDFFDDDNDPYDASSYASARDHGSGRAEEAAEQGDDGAGGIGVCPRCTIVPIRVFDTFVADTNQLGLGIAYAADNGVEVVEIAVGGLTNTHFVREAMRDAYRQGVFFAVVASDLNTANHNFPTFYDESMQVQGTVADVHGLGTNPPNEDVGGFLAARGVPLNAPVQTWFRNSGTTQYGGHAHVVMPGTTGSQATGQAAGAAGLVAAYGRQELEPDLAPNEIKQLLTQTAEDVTAPNTAGTGTPDPAHPGWDQHFGYGRVDLGHALERIRDRRIPPQALITGPPWFEPFEVARQKTVAITGRVAAPRAAGYSFQLEWAPGIEPAADEWRAVGPLQLGTAPFEGTLGTIDLAAVRAALDDRPGGGATEDPTAPAKGPLDQDPNEPAFTVRVRVTDSAGNAGEDRKMLFAFRDETLARGWPQRLRSGGEASQRLWDVDGDRRLDVVLADSSGDLRVLDHAGRPLPTFNGGEPLRTQRYPAVHAGAPVFSRVDGPREPFRTPALGDVDGDLAADIVAAAGEHVYAWDLRGAPLAGFPVRLDPTLSRPQDRTRANHVKRGFVSSPVLADFDPDRPGLEIVIGAMDQHLYAWNGAGQALPGFPLKLRDPSLAGAEIITTPAVGQLVAGGRPEIVTATQEFDDNPARPDCDDLPTCLYSGFIQILANAIGGSGRTYAVGYEGGAWKVLEGWPIAPNGAVPDALPFVAPGIDHVLGNVDADPDPEAIGGLATGDLQAYNADGSVARTYDPNPPGGEHVDKTRVLNLFEYPAVADFDGAPGLEVMKGGITLNGLVNLVAVGQNLPYNHVVQTWNGTSGQSLPTFPQAVEDYQLLSSPAVGDVGDTAGKEILVGTGLYLLRSFNVAGLEATGFPKFTGGWLFAVPALGDADGDGSLDIVTMTREGNAFLWKTGQDACSGASEWWTSRHDERSTGAYGTDTRPPHAPEVVARHRPGAVELTWQRPGDDWACGTPATRRVLTSDEPIRKASDGTLLEEGPAATAEETLLLARSRLKARVAVVYADEAGNWGLPHDVAVPAAPVDPQPTVDEQAPPAGGNASPTATPTASPAPPARPRDVRSPRVSIDADRYGTSRGRFLIRWNASEPSLYEIAIRRLPSQRWRIVSPGIRETTLRYRGVQGTTYQIRIRATDAAGNRGSGYARTVVPLDERRRALRFGPGWRHGVWRKRAFGGSVALARRPGARARLRFRGRAVRVFVAADSGDDRRRQPRRLTAVLDGRRTTLRVRGRGGVFGRPAFAEKGLSPRRRHTLVLIAPDGRVLLDAIAVVR